MRLVLHPKVYGDIDTIMQRYEREASPQLASDFYAELRQLMVEAAKRPKSFAIRERDLRRVNLERFPYHFLFRIIGDAVRILVVRHHRRHPSLGARRR
jgi:plasmid stabilization system protein ParE